jgi:hypothetical protein
MSPIKAKMLQEPRLVRTQVVERVDEAGFTKQIYGFLNSKYESVDLSGNTMALQVSDGRLQFQVESVEVFTVLTTILTLNTCSQDLVSTGIRVLNEVDPLVATSSKVYSTFIVFVSEESDESHAYAVIRESQLHLPRHRLGIGVVRGSLFSILESKDDGERFSKHYFISPLASRDSATQLNETIEDVRYIAVCSAQLSKLLSDSNNLFSALKPGEMEISERTESYLWGLMQPEPVKLETLESWIGYIMEREASLSAMISTMRSNLIQAESIISKIEAVFRRMNERSFSDEPTCLDGEVMEYRRVPKLYEDFIVRSEALKSRLGVVMDSVRTYLSIQQQKLTLEEQKASKEQLVRLVGLQETFHKVEIFVLAVYNTEMARIIFEVVAEHEALLFTAFFIPVALVLAWAVSRILHRE